MQHSVGHGRKESMARKFSKIFKSAYKELCDEKLEKNIPPLTQKVDVVVVAIRSGKYDWRCSCNCYNCWSKEYLIVTDGIWKVPLL